MDSGVGGKTGNVAPALAQTATAPVAAAPVAIPKLEDLYREHVQFVWRSVGALGVAEEAREDLVHEVFLVVRRKLSTFDPTRSERGWLYGIARNLALHHHRATRRRKRRLELLPAPADPPEPEERMQWAEGARRMEDFLDQLDAPKREAFFMSDIEGMTAPEIAQAIEANLATVYSRIRAARLRFEEFVTWLQQDRRRA